MPVSTPVSAVPSTEPALFFNRELSWLDFNHRVLELAEAPALPLLERVRFVAIFSSNLDEFFMKRVGGLRRQISAGVSETSLDGMTPQQQLDAIHEKVRATAAELVELWLRDLQPALAKAGVKLLDYESLSELDRAAADQFFLGHVFPILTPLAVDSGHPFPFLSNLSMSIGIMLEHPTTRERLF